MNTIDGKKLVFIVGSQRSGTTWLHLLLSQSPAIAPLYETRLVSEYMRSCFTVWNERAIPARNVDGLHNFIARPDYLQMLRTFAAAALATGTAAHPSASVILEKSPDHALVACDILSIFPDAYFLHIVRDPRAVVASLKAISGSWGVAWRAVEACERWVTRVKAARAIPSMTQRYREVRYEDLFAGGPRILQEIFAWLGVAASAADCERYFAACRIDALRADEALSQRLHLEIGQGEFFRRGEVDSWKTELASRVVALVEALTGPLMRQLGYATAGAGAGRDIVVRALLAGVELRQALKWRLSRWAEKL
jgi:hypothetical protein